MRKCAPLGCVCVLAFGCAARGPTERPATDRTAETADAAGDVNGDVIGDADAARESEASMNAPDAAPDGQDARALSDAADDAGVVNPATWTNIYNKLLDNMSYASNCTGEGCHSPGIQLGFDLSSPENGYETVQAKLVPGNPSASKIVSRLETGDMPRGRPRMPAADLDLIRRWILAGAPND